MKYYVAIDTGGMKTDSVLFTGDGQVLAHDLRRGANAFDVGPMEAGARICGAIEVLKEALPEGCKLRLPDTPAVYGAALEALWHDGTEADAGFRERFMQSYNDVPVRQ